MSGSVLPDFFTLLAELLCRKVISSVARRVVMLGDQDTQAAFATTEEIFRRMTNLQGQRSADPRLSRHSPEGMMEESRLIDSAAQSNVAISALDARGLYTTEFGARDNGPNLAALNQLQSNYRRSGMFAAEGVMAALADGTGGTFFHNNNDLGSGFKLLTQTPESIYVLEPALDTARPGYIV